MLMTRHSLITLAFLSGATLSAAGGVKDGDLAALPAAAAVAAVRDTPFTALRPPVASVRRSRPGQAPGLIFVTPKKVFGATAVPGAQGGPEILDRHGRVRYFRPNRGGLVANDFRVQQYRGRPVLTYWFGRQIRGSGEGYGVIYDTRYRRVAVVRAGNGLRADFHEFKLTDRGTALLGAYRATRSKGEKVVEGVVQEIDIATGRVVTEWHSLDDVAVSESYEPRGARANAAFDYFHFNSIALDDDGNLVVSARHTWALYKIEQGSGRLLWKLGGKDSDFAMGKGAQTAWQHDAVPEGAGVYRVFDNGAGDVGARRLRDSSRVVRLGLDATARTATLLSARRHPRGLSAGTQGNAQGLSNGNVFVGWGSQGVFSEFSPDGELLFDARVPRGADTYRAYKDRWIATPTEPPHVSSRRSGGRIRVAASWNGSTEVRAWRVLTGRTAAGLRPVGRARWRDLETSLRVPAGDARYVAVRALGPRGEILATSRTRRIPR